MTVVTMLLHCINVNVKCIVQIYHFQVKQQDHDYSYTRDSDLYIKKTS